MVFATDAEGRYTFLSDQASALLGWDIETSIGRHFMEFVAPGWEPEAAASYAALVAEPDIVHTARIDFRGGDGTSIPLEINVVGSMRDGALSAIHGVARDVSERERLERELHESGERFRQLVQTSPDVIYRCDAEGRFTFMAEGSEALFGYAPAAVLGMSFADFTADESLAEAMANFEQQKTEHDVVRRFRYMVKYHDGTTFPAEITSVSVWEDGHFAGVQGTVRDVTMAERLERELRESQERYRFLVENSPDVVFSSDENGLFTFMSESMERMTGWRPEDLIGEPLLEGRRGRQPSDGGCELGPAGRGSGDGGGRPHQSPGTRRPPRPRRGQRHRDDGRGRSLQRHARLDARHQRAGPPRTRAARVRGALPLPGRLVPRPGLADRCQGDPDVRQRCSPPDAGHGSDRADGPSRTPRSSPRRHGATPRSASGG